jgi:hypothetical protein
MRSVVALFRSIATRLDVGVPVTLMTSPFTRAGRRLAIGRPKDGERLSKSIRASQLIDRPIGQRLSSRADFATIRSIITRR